MIVQCKEEDVERNGYLQTDTHTHTQTNMRNIDPAQYTVLGWVINISVTYLKNIILKNHFFN